MRLLTLMILGVFALGCCSEANSPPDSGSGLDGLADESLAPDSPLGPDLPPAPPDAPRVLVLGDSIAAGLHLPEDQAFPRVLQRLLFDRGHQIHLFNAGQSGDTSASGLTRLPWLLKNARPDIVVIELGGNDGLRLQPVDNIYANLAKIIRKCVQGGHEVLLLGVLIPTSSGPEYVASFNAIYPRLAEEFEIEYLPYFMRGVGGVKELNLPDGLHPKPQGHVMIAKNVLPALEAMLPAPQVAPNATSESGAGR